MKNPNFGGAETGTRIRVLLKGMVINMKFKINRNAKSVLLLGAALLVVIAAAVTAWAVFFDKDTDTVDGRSGVVNIKLHENFGTYTDGVTGTAVQNTNEKTFWVENIGNKRCYVRVRLETAVETEEGDPVAVPQDSIQYTINAPGWIDGGDGYWYYSKILAPGELTSKFYVLDVQLVNVIPSDAGTPVLRMDVHHEAAQATHELYKTIWNITDLPPGVERLPAGE